MTPRNSLTLVLVCVAVAPSARQAALAAEPANEQAQKQADPFRGALLCAEQVTESRLRSLKSARIRVVALQLRGDAEARMAERQACARIQRSKLALYYWIEVARCPELADAHPTWMASLQGHSQWRRLFKDPPTPRNDEVVKTYPWVPILNEEPYQGQLRRVRKLLEDLPQPKGVFLNDLQGAPSACGCGNHLCRWTTDYGKIRIATPPRFAACLALLCHALFAPGFRDRADGGDNRVGLHFVSPPQRHSTCRDLHNGRAGRQCAKTRSWARRDRRAVLRECCRGSCRMRRADGMG